MRETDHKVSHPRVDRYLYAMLPVRSAVLAEIEQQADEERLEAFARSLRDGMARTREVVA